MCAEEDVTVPETRVQDRRIQKTQRLLHEALFSLIHEKSYDAIVVKEILDRANVGRSTFYTHFRNKDELLVSGIHDMLRSVESAGRPPSATRYERILWFSLPIFEHISYYRRAGRVRIGTRGRGIMHEYLQHVLAELMAEDVRTELQRRREKVGQVPPDLFVQYVASTFILVLHWWVDSRSPLPPKDVNDVFRALVLPTMTAALE
jgi:AcrR family transcriptional regulator